MKKSPRLQFEIRVLRLVQPQRTSPRYAWALFAPGNEFVRTMTSKRPLVEWAATELNALWDLLRVRSELTIKDKAGDIQDKRTYGEDPVRSKG